MVVFGAHPLGLVVVLLRLAQLLREPRCGAFVTASLSPLRLQANSTRCWHRYSFLVFRMRATNACFTLRLNVRVEPHCGRSATR